MSLFLDRSRRPGHGLEWKVGAFTVGAVMALTGIYFGERWLTGAAILVLVLGAFWRFPYAADSEPAATPGPTNAPEPADVEGGADD